MTLQVPFDQFPSTVQRLIGASEAYLTRHAGGVLVTAARPERAMVVVAMAELSIEDAMTRLAEAGVDSYEGAWSTEGALHLATASAADAYIAAVGFESGEGRPGVWIDAYDALPTQVQVLRAMYDEFRDTGELPEVAFEEFVRMVNATVVVISPSDVRSFLAQKAAGCD